MGTEVEEFLAECCRNSLPPTRPSTATSNPAHVVLATQ
jgi:hypothetical protein